MRKTGRQIVIETCRAFAVDQALVCGRGGADWIRAIRMECIRLLTNEKRFSSAQIADLMNMKANTVRAYQAALRASQRIQALHG